MKWIVGGAFLLVLGIFLRWVLKLENSTSSRRSLSAHLGADRENIYQPVAQEIVTQSSILGVSLNDAIEHRHANQPEMAWRLVQLAVSEWERLTEILTALTNLMAAHAGSARLSIPGRPILAERFKSRLMIDSVRTHELFDQLVFRSRLRFQLHLRMLRRANETLTAELGRLYRSADRSGDHPPELWENLDHYFHDLDLVAKETLLAFRALLPCLPNPDLALLKADTTEVIRRGVRAKVSVREQQPGLPP